MRLALTLAALVLASACSKNEPVTVPEAFRVKFVTSEGEFIVEANRAWAPRGVDRFHELLRMKYFDQGRFFRVVPNFIAQFGVHKDFSTHAVWREFFILDDKPDAANRQSNKRGTLAFAQSGPNTRATEIFINLKDNAMLDEERFLPFAKVVEGMDVVDRLYSGYGELRPTGRYIEPGRVEEGGNSYLVPRFPALDYITKTEILN